MKWFLVVYFLVGDNWYSGEVVEPDGWSSIEYSTQEECETRRDFMNEKFESSKFKGMLKGVCQTNSPDMIQEYKDGND